MALNQKSTAKAALWKITCAMLTSYSRAAEKKERPWGGSS